jgi:iron complex transport system substrate-binding protein
MIKHYCRHSRIAIFFTIFIIVSTAPIFPDEQKSPAEITSVKATSNTRTITYYKDKTITVPYKISRIACGWPAQNSVVTMLGYGDKIVATYDMIRTSPIFIKFVPSITRAVSCFNASGELNIESLTQVKPDLVFSPETINSQFKRLEDMGISVAYLKANSLQNLLNRTVITGQILGDDAYRHAQKYVRYFNNNVKRVADITSQIPENKRMNVYHCISNPLYTASAPSLVQDWMDNAGVVNIAKDWKVAALQTGSNITLEQIIGADPDVIICLNAKDAAAIKADPAWRIIKAVKECKVYTNPKGLFYWGRETTEEALQFLWLAKTVYPDNFKNVDMAQETKYFYKTFYRLNLTDKDVQLFLYPN